MDKHIVVIAKSIDRIHIKFDCPFCWSRYKRNGMPYATARRKVHQHGSNGNLINRVETRGAHCDPLKFPIDMLGFSIHVTDETIRL